LRLDVAKPRPITYKQLQTILNETKLSDVLLFPCFFGWISNSSTSWYYNAIFRGLLASKLLFILNIRIVAFNLLQT